MTLVSWLGGYADLAKQIAPTTGAATQTYIAPRLRPTRQRTSLEGKIAYPATTDRYAPIAVSRKDQTDDSINEPTMDAVGSIRATRALTLARAVHAHCLSPS